MQKVIDKSTLRTLVKVLLEDKSLGPAMVKVNPVVDQSAPLTDPSNPDFKPANKSELKIAFAALASELPDENIPSIYDSIKNSIDLAKEETKEDPEMKNTKVEEAIRVAIRNIIKENYLKEETAAEKKERLAKEKWATGASGEAAREKFLAAGGTVTKVPAGVGTTAATRPDPSSLKDLRSRLEASLQEPGATTSATAKKNLGVADVGGEGLKDLAAEFGFKNPNGVLQWINKVIEKMKGRIENYEEYQVAVLEIMNQFLNDLSAPYKDGKNELSPVLEPADVELMKANPQLVEELPMFREYLAKNLKKRGM
jgi:hypothetical protein